MTLPHPKTWTPPADVPLPPHKEKDSPRAKDCKSRCDHGYWHVHSHEWEKDKGHESEHEHDTDPKSMILVFAIQVPQLHGAFPPPEEAESTPNELSGKSTQVMYP